MAITLVQKAINKALHEESEKETKNHSVFWVRN